VDDAHAVQERQGGRDLVHEAGGVGLGIGPVVDQMLEHFPARDEIEDEVVVVMVLVHVPQSGNVGVAAVVVDAQEGVRFGLEGGRVGVLAIDLFEGHLAGIEREGIANVEANLRPIESGDSTR
jgi:hypothetical protein